MAYCDQCSRYFRSEQALTQHQRSSSYHHFCLSCDRDFVSDAALTQHYKNSSRHSYCTLCQELVEDSGLSLCEHADQFHWPCSGCTLVYATQRGLHEHCAREHADRWCGPCKRIFISANNLRQHRASSVHQAATHICPMKGCSRAFISRADVVRHLESEACTSGMTRAMVDRIVAQIDRGGVITNPARLIEGPSARKGVIKTWATERAWNGRAYECYLCHKSFVTLVALNRHLDSPAHGDKLYHCPRQLGGCGKETTTLSAFFQHVESGCCGVVRFKDRFGKMFDDVSRAGRLLTL